MSDTCGFCQIHDCWHGAPGEEARGEQRAVANYLRKCAEATRKHASAMRADAGTQAEPEARGVDRAALALDGAAEVIEKGGHWR